ncbi:DUF3592 domain-containing protein, partial [Kitasatospora nipponensis]
VPAAALAVPGRRRLRRDRAEARVRAEREERLSAHGVSAGGTVTELTGTGASVNDWPELRLTVRFEAADGAVWDTTHTDWFPVYRLPRVGDAVTVRYDPADPRLTAVELPEQGAAQGAKQEQEQEEEQGRAAEPEWPGALERLAALHRAGSLSEREFTLAKARLLSDGEPRER